jgi:O-antigen biosynthesis protein
MLQSIKIFFRHLILKNQLKKEKITSPKYVFGKKNILIVDEHIPEFDKDSGSRRMTEIIKILIKNDFKVFLLSDQKEYRFNQEYVPYFEKMGVIVYKPHLVNNKLITKEKFLHTITPKLSWAILSRPDIYDKYNDVIKNLNPKCTLIYDMVDFHYIRFLREFELTNSEIALSQANKYKEIETSNCLNSDVTIAVSNKDKEYLEESNIVPKSVKIISNIHEPNPKTSKDFNKRKDLLFIGGFKHAPNIDAVKQLHSNIMPLIWNKSPDIKIHIIGSNVPNEIKALHSENFIIHGFVEDVTTFFNSCKVFIAPLQYGAGIKGKIGQSFEYNLPVVTTTIGLEGFNFHSHEKNMVAEIGEDFALKTLEIYNNEKLWNEIHENCVKILTPFSTNYTESILLETLK